MNNAEIAAALTSVFRAVLDDDGLVDSRALEAQHMDQYDSLTHLRLMLSVERAFKTKFSAADTRGLRNVGDLVELVASKLKAAGR
jgi:acyl carrier protein